MSQTLLYVCIYVSITHPLSTVGTNYKSPTVQGHQRNNKFYERANSTGECHLEDAVLHVLLTWHLYHFIGLLLQYYEFCSREKRDKKLRNVAEFHTIFGIEIKAVMFEIVVDQEKKLHSMMAYGVNRYNS